MNEIVERQGTDNLGRWYEATFVHACGCRTSKTIHFDAFGIGPTFDEVRSEVIQAATGHQHSHP